MSGIAAWFVYGTVVTAFLGLGAWALEASARAVNRQARWVWLGAMALAVVVPAVAYLVPGGRDGIAAAVPEVGVLTLPAVVVPAAARTVSAGTLLVAAWLSISLVLAGAVMFSAARLRADRWRWTRANMYGVPVWVTDDLGPAVFGWRAPSILMPRWVLALDQPVQRLLMLHEREHVRAGDSRMVLAGMALLVAMPWNLALWWMLARLRLAVELDCDARVLEQAPDARAYGGVLLEVGQRRSGLSAAVAFAEPRRFLETRLRRLTAMPAAHPVARVVAFGVLGASSLVLAMCARDPLAPAPADPAEMVVMESDPLEVLQQDGPTFTPMTIKPGLTNVDEVKQELTAAYPAVLRDAGIGGSATVWFYINETGRVLKTQVHQSSGYDQLDRAAMRVAGTMRFTPAMNRDRRVPVWVAIPITFASR